MQDIESFTYVWSGGKVERIDALDHDGSTEIDTANVTINSSEFSVQSVYTDPRKYDPKESEAAVETLETALKTTELYVYA